MRLTNTIRDAFIRSAMNDVPSVDYTEQIRKLALDDIVDQLPEPVRKIWNDTKTRCYIETTWGNFGGVSVTHPCDGHRAKLTSQGEKKLAVVIEKQKAQKELHDALRQKLRSAAYACSTRKALAEMLPEFEKYLPADEAKAAAVNLPAIANIVTDFVKAGWPKNQKLAASK